MSLHGRCLYCGKKIMACRGFCSNEHGLMWYESRKAIKNDKNSFATSELAREALAEIGGTNENNKN